MTNPQASGRTFLFVTGAPRSGTTFVSDWISETEDSYVCHEVLPELAGMPVEAMWAYLANCARTGMDRMGKVKQLEFMSWQERQRTAVPRILGLKEPVAWDGSEAPQPIASLLAAKPSLCIVLIRHPYDVVTSGMRRGRQTSNWPGYSVNDHCRLWLQTLALAGWVRRMGTPVLLVRWEELFLEHEAVKEKIEEFVGVSLPGFTGFERRPTELAFYAKNVSKAHGLRDADRRQELSNADRDEIKAVVGSEAREMGYCLDEWDGAQ